MRILITGGAGCLGANIVQRYARSASILVLDNFATSSRETLPANSTAFEVVQGSVTDRALVDGLFARFLPDIVIHSAASYRDPADWRGDLDANATGSINVVEAARRADVKRFINFQTALCYGRPDRTPIPVDAPLRPVTSYGISKTAGEHYVMASGLNAISLRLANVTGPRLSIGPIPAFYSRLKAGKPCFCSPAIRDFLDMEDFLTLLDLVVVEDGPHGVFNVSTGEGHSIRDVFDAVSAHLGLGSPAPASLPLANDDVLEVVLDPSRTAAAFGWRAKVSFGDSMKRILQWYDVHGVQAIYSHLAAPETQNG
jgi:UDP-glucose 4-epimerase